MKLFVAVLLVAAAAADRLENTYLPPNSAKTAGGSGNFLATPKSGAVTAGAAHFAQQQQYSSNANQQQQYSNNANQQQQYSNNANQQQIGILRLDNENNGDGTYNYALETENGIQQQESGQLKNAGSQDETIEAQGSFSFTAPDGQTFNIQYVADENGFQPQGAHLPTAPPVPEEILKALEKNAADEAAGIVDDGQYKPDPSEGYAGKQYQQQQGGAAAASVNGHGVSNGGYKY